MIYCKGTKWQPQIADIPIWSEKNWQKGKSPFYFLFVLCSSSYVKYKLRYHPVPRSQHDNTFFLFCISFSPGLLLIHFHNIWLTSIYTQKVIYIYKLDDTISFAGPVPLHTRYSTGGKTPFPSGRKLSYFGKKSEV
jgi:hypothetical protein